MSEKANGERGAHAAGYFPVDVLLQVIWTEGTQGLCEPAHTLQAAAHGGVVHMKKSPPLGAEATLANALTGEHLTARVVGVQPSPGGQGFEVTLQFPGVSESFWGASFRLKKMTAELAALEQAIRCGDVNPRALRDFRDAVDHIRKTAWVVQEWEERKAQGRETETILSMLTLERIRRAAQLTNDLAGDLETHDIPGHTIGLGDLFTAVERLQHILANQLHRN